MKKSLTIVKFFMLACILVAIFIGYQFYNVWDKDERAEVLEITFSSAEVKLGEAVTLRTSVKLPWHREITSPEPLRLPESLITTQGGVIQKGALDLNGYRQWDIAVPFVITGLEVLEGKVIELGLNKSTRISPTNVPIPVPALNVILPSKPSKASLTVSSASTVKAPIQAQLETPDPAVSKWWMYLLGAIVLLVICYFIIRKWMPSKSAVPPWINAQRELRLLQKNLPENPAVFYISLTDIMKRYTSQRFETHSDSATAPELIATLNALSEVNAPRKASLSKIIQQADGVKFASLTVDTNTINDALTEVDQYIEETIPIEEDQQVENKEVKTDA